MVAAQLGLLFDAFVPLTTASGMMANASLGSIRVPFPPGLFDLPEPERGAIMGELARARLLADPLPVLTEMARATALAFAYEEAPLARFRHTTPPIDAMAHARLAMVLQGSWFVLLASACLAAWRGLRRGLADPVAIYALVLLLAILAINPWFEFGERHRLVLIPFLLVMAVGLLKGKIAR